MDFNSVKKYLFDAAKKAGLSEYEVYFMESDGISAETLKDEVSSFSSTVSGGICFRCIVDGKIGSAATELFTREEMEELVLRAANNAKYIENDDKAIIFEGSKEYQKISPVNMATADAAQIKDVALELIKKTYEQSEYIADGTQTYAVQEKTRMILANSHGLYLENEVGVCGALVQAVVAKDGESQYGGDIETGLDREKLERLPKDSIDEALSKIGAIEIPSGKYDIIFDGKQMRALLSAFSSVFSGRNAYLGLSLLKGKEGEKIGADCLTVVDDPMYSQSPMQTAFDGEGVATYKKNVIENGVLKTLLYDIASADKVGKESTGNGLRSSYASAVSISPYHFYIDGGNMSDDELFARLGNGIYITELKGLHAGANAVTGDFSIESAGFEIKDGKIGKAVKSFTVAGNFLELIKNIEALSNNVKFGFPAGFTVFGAPNTLIRACSVAGT